MKNCNLPLDWALLFVPISRFVDLLHSNHLVLIECECTCLSIECLINSAEGAFRYFGGQTIPFWLLGG